MHWDFWNFRKRRRQEAEAKAAFLTIIRQRCVSEQDYEGRIALSHWGIKDVKVDTEYGYKHPGAVIYLKKGADGFEVARAVHGEEENWKPLGLFFDYQYEEAKE